ncbi:hypothetical protein [Streptomyces sp. CBMA123]|uniref:hypothetical protein n=1 Tax=Streptomyces sp. CBMA123 TaxID=1896313 RepID=UPI00166219B2|nr:hypothetical protein [Streptomyces sp. CBMA123]
MTKRNTDQQRARELQQAEGISYHAALNRVRETRESQPAGPEINSSVVLTESTLIALASAGGSRCMACHKPMDFDGWALRLADVSGRGYFDPVLCLGCATAIGKAVAHLPAHPAPDPDDLDTLFIPAGADGTVAYLSPDRVHLLCLRHAPAAPAGEEDRYEPVTAEDLQALGTGFRPGGGGHHCSICNLHVLEVLDA